MPKKTTSPVLTPDPPTPSIAHLPTLDERFLRIRNVLVLSRAAADAMASSEFDRDELIEAVKDLCEDEIDEMYWLTQLPGLVLNLPAPTDDQAEPFGPKDDDGETGRSAIVKLYFGGAR